MTNRKECMASRSLRFARLEDASAFSRIYGPIVLQTAISFEIEPPGPAEFAERIRSITAKYPWLCMEIEGEVVGYAYGSSHRARAAYEWSVEVSAYVSEIHRGEGIGKALYQALFQILKLQGFHTALAGITLPNEGSVALHESLGMKPLGIYHSVGFKHDGWHDVGWWELNLQGNFDRPQTIKPISALQGSPQVKAALSLRPEI